MRLSHFCTITLITIASGTTICSLTACQSTATIKEATNMKDRLLGEWKLATLAGTDVASMIKPGSATPSLNFAPDGSISGTGGINRIMGSFEPAAAAQGKISLDRMASTRMAGEPGAMQLEQQFLAALAKADSFSFDAQTGGLYLKKGSEAVAYFVKAGKK